MGRGDRRHGGRRYRWLPIGVVLLVLAVAFGSFQYDVPRRLGWDDRRVDPVEVEPPTGLELPEPRVAAPVAPSLSPTTLDGAKVRAAVAPYLRDRDLGPHVVAAVASPGGATVFGDPAATFVPASTLKLLTGVAALEAVGPERTFDTTVVTGSSPGEVVLVGGGDPFLAAEPDRGAYPRPADLSTLARRTAVALRDQGRARVRLGFDDSLFAGPTWAGTWPARESAGEITYDDVVSPITALWVDQGSRRQGPGFEDDPAAAAAAVFAQKLRAAGIGVAGRPRRASASTTAPELAAVQSPPVRDVVARVIAASDNEGAEVLAHHVARAEGLPGSFADGARAVTAVLGRLGVTLRRGEVIHDGSGLSRRNRLSAATLLDVLALAASADHPELRVTLTGLPVAGFSGSLAGRFADGPVAGRGRVRAKTGTLTGVHGLAGVTTDVAGNLMAFVLLADRVGREDSLDAREALDRAAAALGACRCSR